MQRKKLQFLIIGALVVLGAVFGIGSQLPVLGIPQVQAIDVGTNVVDQTIGLSGQDPRIIVAKIIRAALGLLGIVTVGFILYGGFVWMTAGGNEDNVGAAKRILTNAVIGLVIILSAFSITQFVLSRLIDATGAGGQNGGSGGGGGGSIGTLSPDAFVVRDISPQDPAPPQLWPRNTQVKIHMNQNVDPTTIRTPVITDTTSNSIVVHVRGDQAQVPGAYVVDGTTVTFTPTEPCPEPNQDRFCFARDTTFVVEVKPDLLKSATVPQHSVTCGGLANSCTAEFTVDNYVDTEAPEVGITVPSAMQSIPIGFQTVTAHATDDVAVSEIRFYDSEAAIPDGVASVSPPITPYDGNIGWDTSQLPGESCRSLTARATDVDTNSTISTAVPVVIRPQHCFNGRVDGGETGPDCGGDPLSIEYCGKCAGEACGATDSCVAFCRSGACVDGHCVDIPRIDGFSPAAAGPGSYLTITGEFFGSAPGAVYFLGGDGPQDDVPAELAPCATAWSANSHQIIVTVPTDTRLATGAIMVVTRDGKQDTTVDDRGFVGNFTPTTTQFPGICGIDPISEQSGAPFALIGNGFGEIQGNSSVHFVRPSGSLDDKLVTDASWNPNQITGTIPTAAPGLRNVYATVSGNNSNPVAFTVLATDTGSAPFIRTITPSRGPAGTYVTLGGANFGTTGQVIFTNNTSSGTAIGDTDFPEQCTDFWRDDEVTIKVPTTYSGGSFQGNDLAGTPIAQALHKIKIRRGDTNGTLSNEVDFTVNGGIPPPGICGMNPISGHIATPVHFYGYGFGDLGNTIARFFENKTSLPQMLPSSHEVVNPVPPLATSGTVTIEVSNAVSNPRAFKVGDCRETKDLCGKGYECCINGTCAQQGHCQAQAGRGGYAWYLSTGPIPQVPRLIFECDDGIVRPPIPSPSPLVDRPGGKDVCVNAIVTGRFSIPMDKSTIVKPNLSFKSCAGDDGNLSCITDAGYTLDTPDWSGGTAFRMIPAALLQDTWYEVKLSTGILGSVAMGHEHLQEDAARCGTGFAYCWRFKTKKSNDLCKLTAVQVEPADKTAIALGENVIYTMFGSTDVACIRLKTSDYLVDWTADKPAGHADIRANGTIPVGTHEGHPPSTLVDPWPDSDKTVATAHVETTNNQQGPVDITGRVASENISGTAQLTIDFTDPEVVEYWPNCPAACINSGIGIKFNTAMDMDSITPVGRFKLAACLNESCQVTTPIILNNPRLDETRTILRADHPVLATNAYYRVTLSGLVQSTSHVSLTKTNYLGNFSWIFRTKPSNVPCAVNRIDILPQDAIVSVIGDRVPYESIPYGAPDECAVQGQELSASQYNWRWSSQDASIATLIQNGAVDTKQILPIGCSNQCLNTGALGVAGKDAVCGDNRIGLGEECEDGNTNSGDGCSGNCLLEGSTGGAICGNGKACQVNADCQGGAMCSQVSFHCVELGEECDEGNVQKGDGCSDRCLLEGSVAGAAQCGNGSIGVGEACDDGNTVSGDGCSSACLKEGSHPAPFAICGDGQVDLSLGEECDSGAGCDPKTCLHTGVSSCNPPFPSNQAGCCGNNNANEAGKDCDDGNSQNGDGCSEVCLKEGSSPFYATPAFCGDGVRGIGEECEAVAGGGDGKVDPAQVAQAVGMGVVVNGLQTTTVNAITENVTGAAPFTLQCGFKTDADCRNVNAGLGTNTCCYLRPTVSQTTPAAFEGATAEAGGPLGVCRNPLISATFVNANGGPVMMDLASFTGNVILAKNVNGACPAKSKLLAILPLESENFITRDMDLAPEIDTPETREVALWWTSLKQFFGEWVLSAEASHTTWPTNPGPQGAGSIPGNWCVGEGVGIGRASGLNNGNGTSTLYFQITSGALDPYAWYRVIVVGDTPNDNAVTGVRSVEGVGMDAGAGHNYEWYFHTGGEICQADAVGVIDINTLSPGLITSASPHSFQASAISKRGVNVASIVPLAGVYDWQWQPWSSSDTTIVTAAATGADTDNPNPATVAPASPVKNGQTLANASLKIVTDELNKPVSTKDKIVSGSAKVEVFLCENPGLQIQDVGAGNVLVGGNATQPFGNFTTRFCRDAGKPNDKTDDFADRILQAISVSPPGILKEFVVRNPNYLSDAIGFRAIENSSHYSALRWYRLQGFKGDPQALTVDGYDAVRDGRTVYVNAPNIATDGKLHSNIYTISYNEGATPETQNVFEQFVANIHFLANLPNPGTVDTQFCVDGNGVNVDGDSQKAGTQPISCSSDFDCPVANSCRSATEKIRRDMRRLADFRDVEALFNSYQITTSKFPTLQSGTFVRSMSTSVWPSWTQTLAPEVGAVLPNDPLNKFMGCSRRCAIQNINCTKDDDCKAGNAADTCSTGNDPVTCFDQIQGIYKCPAGSHIYQYTSVGATSYKLETDLEQQTFAWSPTIAPILPGGQVALKVDQGGAPVCTGNQFGQSRICGDGVVGGEEVCELGQTRVGNCNVNGKNGTVNEICKADCISGWDTQPGAICIAQYCGDGIIQQGEICDDGANNGTYGKCSANCQGTGPYCGDSVLAGGEQCDLGALNGQYATKVADSCSWNCTYPGLYCGDKVVNGPESCDANAQSGRALCSNDHDRPCNTDGDCTQEGTCSFEACNPKVIGGITYPQARTRGCKNDCGWGAIDQTQNGCQVIGSCGDGAVQGNEECDDGNRINADACTNQCRKNICGDGYPTQGQACDFGKAPLVPSGTNGVLCQAPYGGTCNYCSNNCNYLTQTGPYCGDGTYTEGAERCDATANPIVARHCNVTTNVVCASDNQCPLGERCLPIGFDQALSRCGVDCKALCPPDFSTTSLLFQSPQPANRFNFKQSGTPNSVLLPACRVGGGLAVDLIFGADVIHFPSPMDVMFLLDNSGSMTLKDFECDAGNVGNESRLQCMRKALCGTIDCATMTDDSIIAQLYDSRPAGDVRIGITEFGISSKYRTWGNGANAATDDCAKIPCYTNAEYQADTAPTKADDSGFLVDSVNNRTALRTIVKNMNAPGSTPTYLGLKQDRVIFKNDTHAKTKVLILMSDGDSYDDVKTTEEAKQMNKIEDEVYIFTVSIPVARQSMKDWADPTTGNADFSITFNYAGNNIGDMLKQIISSMGVKIQISNVGNFQAGQNSWVDNTMVTDEGFSIPLNAPHLVAPASPTSCNTLDTRTISIRALYATKGGDSGVTISNMRFQYCPVAGY